MADYLHDDVYDNGLAPLTTLVENLYICSAQPADFTEASVTYKLGTKAAPTITGPTDRGGSDGRQVTVSAISDGTIDASGDATHFALTDDSATKLLAAGDLAALQAVTIGNPFSLNAFNIGIPDPTTQE